MAWPSTYQSLPGDWKRAKPLIDRSLQSISANIGQVHGTSKQPYPPRNVRFAVSGGVYLLSWDLPVKASDVAGFKIYVGSEFVPSFIIANPKQLSLQMNSAGSYLVGVSCFNASGKQSQIVCIAVHGLNGSGASYTNDFIKYSRRIGGG